MAEIDGHAWRIDVPLLDLNTEEGLGATEPSFHGACPDVCSLDTVLTMYEM